MGKVDGCYYVINSTGGFAPEGTGTASAVRIRSVVVNDLAVRRGRRRFVAGFFAESKEDRNAGVVPGVDCSAGC